VIARSFILHTSAGWRWSYYLGIILSVIALALYQFFYHPPTYTQLHVQGKTKRQQLKELDYGGIFLFTAGMVLFLIGLSWGGTTYPWKSAQVLATLIVGFALLVALGFYGTCYYLFSSRPNAEQSTEAYFVKHTALIPPRLFRNIGYVAIVACATIGAMVYYSMTVLWPTIIGTVYSTDVMTIGWFVLPIRSQSNISPQATTNLSSGNHALSAAASSAAKSSAAYPSPTYRA